MAFGCGGMCVRGIWNLDLILMSIHRVVCVAMGGLGMNGRNVSVFGDEKGGGGRGCVGVRCVG